ncbi:hypothetical protein BpHYR1_004651 [Brachionus plicatilis]|uniref:Uncharacterized protein n=1 Tax=Brachionus plicatilis TaxID=10195 RepID=A0A3M7S811_BRAPC|nr:hypothetical protein BpHYR1_004651 [Brachionus plicatilis]
MVLYVRGWLTCNKFVCELRRLKSISGKRFVVAFTAVKLPVRALLGPATYALCLKWGCAFAGCTIALLIEFSKVCELCVWLA